MEIYIALLHSKQIRGAYCTRIMQFNNKVNNSKWSCFIQRIYSRVAPHPATLKEREQFDKGCSICSIQQADADGCPTTKKGIMLHC